MTDFPPDVASSAVWEPLVAEPAAAIARVPEAAVQDAWVRGLFAPSALATTEGEAVEVVDLGRLNRDSGPDITDARLVIGGLLWAGDVEVHQTSSGWTAHGHHEDRAYNRVVLHVVLSPDRQTGTLRRADGTPLPELVLLPHLDRSLRSLLHDFYVRARTAPQCAHRWPDVPPEDLRQWVRWLGVERLRNRAAALGRAYGRRPDLDRLLVGRVFRALGYDANAGAMEELARRAPLTALRQLAAPDVHAVLFGLSGLADGSAREDDRLLMVQFEQVAFPLGLTPMARESWRRGGRPANAPRTRIAQAAALLAPGGVLRTDAIDGLSDAVRKGAGALTKRLRAEPVRGSARLGAGRAERIASDAVLPVLLLHAEQCEDPGLESAVLDVYDALAPARDRVVRQVEDAGFCPRSALEAQGAHQLVRAYCDEGCCARCAVGTSLYPALGRAR